MKRGATETTNKKESSGKRLNAALSTRGRWRHRKGRLSYFKLGAWNVRTMLWKLRLKRGHVEVIGQGLGKENVICQELENKGIALCALSEVRWKGQGEYQYGDYTLVYTGREDDLSQEGVAIALNPVIAQARKDTGKQVQHTSSRVMSIRFALGGDTYTVISVYAPTFRAESAAKDEFYDSVRKEIEKANSSDTIICLGDWNARVGT